MKSLQLQVAVLPNMLGAPPIVNSGSVVIDTLRFTTTAAKALSSDCQTIHIAGSIQQALMLAEGIQAPLPALLCGERNCRPIAGFDLGNSPLEYSSERVQNRQLIFTTTNGTVAVQAARDFQHCLLGSLVNRTAIARRIAELQAHHWQIICAGTDGEIAGEDVLAAGAIIESLSGIVNTALRLLNDSAIMALQLWQQVANHPNELSSLLSGFAGGRNLIEAGYKSDIEFSARLDLLNVVPMLSTGKGFFTRG